MTAEEIRKLKFSPRFNSDLVTDVAAWQCAEWLREIAAQLAELNSFLKSPGEWAIMPPNFTVRSKPQP